MDGPFPKLEDALTITKEAHDGKCVLPEFQRSFVWANPDIKSLLVSVLSGYFVGTVLFLRRGDNFDFKLRYFEGTDKVNTNLPTTPDEKNADRTVLDGQQRLTALFYALYAPESIKPKGSSAPIRYFINARNRLDGKDWDEAIIALSENDRTNNIEMDIGSGLKKSSFKQVLDWSHGYLSLLGKQEFKELCYKNLWVPLPYLKERADLENWLEDYGSYLASKSTTFDDIKAKKKAVRDIFNPWFEFKIPSLTLEHRPFYEVAEIFERINKTGVELSVFALATAVFFKQNINLRDWWNEYYSDVDTLVKPFALEDDEEYPKIVLQIMALRQALEVKKKSLVNPKVFKVEKASWNESAALLDKALERLQNTTSGYGVINPSLLPYRTIIVTLAALIEHCKTADHYKKLDVWYWSSVFTERYAGSSDTIVKQDYDQVKQWLADDTQKPEAVREANSRIVELDLENTTKGALTKAILNLMALEGTLDFYTGQSIELCKLNDHHIFPKKSGIPMTNENSVLNRTLIQDSTNNDIRTKKPSEYIPIALGKLGNEVQLKAMLKSHFINEEAITALKSDNYADFIKARAKVVIEKLTEKTKYGEEIKQPIAAVPMTQ